MQISAIIMLSISPSLEQAEAVETKVFGANIEKCLWLAYRGCSLLGFK